MTEIDKMRYEGLDFLKFVACILVVFIHCKFPGEFGLDMRAIGRIAVPFFLMVSGFFSVNKSLHIETASLNKKTKHILNLILFSLVFYVLYHLGINFFLLHNSPIDVVIGYVASFNLKKFVVINTLTYYHHLWFLFALLYCYLLLYPSFVRRALLNRQVLQTSIILTLIIFVLSSEILPFLGKDIQLLGFKSQHIFLFRALPFFLIGLYTRLYQPLKNININVVLIVALLGIGLSLIERHYQIQDSQAYIGSILCAFLMLLYGLRSKQKFPEMTVVGGAKLSLYVYIYHIALIPVTSKLSPTGWLTPIIVVIISFIMAGITVYVKENIKRA